MNALHLFLRKNLVLTPLQTPYLHFFSSEPFHFFYKLFNSIVFCRISNSIKLTNFLLSYRSDLPSEFYRCNPSILISPRTNISISYIVQKFLVIFVFRGRLSAWPVSLSHLPEVYLQISDIDYFSNLTCSH